MKKELHFLFMGMSHDQHLHRVAKCIEQQNGLVQLIDSRQIPNQPDASSLHLGEKDNSWDVIWIRHLPPLFPGAAHHFKPEEIQKQRALRGYVLQWLAQQIAQGELFPRLTGHLRSIQSYRSSYVKQAQLQAPVSLNTLSMEEALNFINEQGQDLILKPMMVVLPLIFI